MGTLERFYRSAGYNRSLDSFCALPPNVPPREVALKFCNWSAVVVRDIVPAAPVARLRAALDSFETWRAERPEHSTHTKPDAYWLLWEMDGPTGLPIADMVAAVVASPLRAIMAALIGAADFVIPLSHTGCRGVPDDREVATPGEGFHQDYRVVNPLVPFNLWLPLDAVEVGERSALGFWVAPYREAPERARLVEFCDARPEWIWLPSYAPGDAALFTSRTPHTTTHYRTGKMRWAFELRYMPAIPDAMAGEPFAIVRGDRLEWRNLPPDARDKLAP